jgi:hypothetical protein
MNRPTIRNGDCGLDAGQKPFILAPVVTVATFFDDNVIDLAVLCRRLHSFAIAVLLFVGRAARFAECEQQTCAAAECSEGLA